MYRKEQDAFSNLDLEGNKSTQDNFNFTTENSIFQAYKVKATAPQKYNNNQEKDNNYKDEASFHIIDYPYEEQEKPIENKQVTPFQITKPTQPTKGNDSLDKTMSDFLEHFNPKTDGKIEFSFPNESVNNSINTYHSGNNTSLNFCCVYCEEIYKNCLNNNYPITEKQCIYCGRLITKETFEQYKLHISLKNKKTTSQQLSQNNFFKKNKKISKTLKMKPITKNIKTPENLIKNETKRHSFRLNTFTNTTLKTKKRNNYKGNNSPTNSRANQLFITNSSSKFEKVKAEETQKSQNSSKILKNKK